MAQAQANRSLASAMLASLVLPWLSGCCAGPACGQQTSFEIHLAVGRTTLDGSELTICRGDACSSGKPVWRVPEGGWEAADFALSGMLLPSATRASVGVTPDDRSLIQVAAPVDRNGDRFNIRLVDSQGTTLLDFARTLQYEQMDACGQHCLGGASRVWPNSPNGLTCSARTCSSGAAITTEVSLPDGYSDEILIETCRNDLCGSVTWPSLVRAGILGAGVSEVAMGNRREFRLTVQEDPALLADGDRYRVTITDDQQNTLAAIDRVATYSETYPNGSECDPYPCRWAEVVP